MKFFYSEIFILSCNRRGSASFLPGALVGGVENCTAAEPTAADGLAARLLDFGS